VAAAGVSFGFSCALAIGTIKTPAARAIASRLIVRERSMVSPSW